MFFKENQTALALETLFLFLARKLLIQTQLDSIFILSNDLKALKFILLT